MKRLLHLTTASLLLLFSLLTALQIPAGTAQAASHADGEYTVGFTILKNDSTEASMMDTYTEKPAKLTVEKGKITAFLTLKQSKEITDFKVEQNGALVDTVTVSEDVEANTRVIKFDVADLSSKLKGWVKIYWDLGSFVYDEAYDVQLSFDQSSLTLVSPADPDDSTTTPDDDNTTKPDDTTTTPDDDNTTKPDDTTTTPDDDNTTKPDDTTTTPDDDNTTKPDDSSHQGIKDGVYRLSYEVLKGDTDEASRMNQYFSHPASLTVKNGKQTVSFTVKDDASVASVKTEQNGTYQEVKTVSKNEAKNTRVVSFEVADLSKAVKGKVHIVVAAANYNQTYDIRFKFDPSSIQAQGDNSVDEETPTTTPNPPTKPETTDGGSNQEAVELKDGVYQLPFSIKQADKDELSRMNDYVVSPATLVVKNGRHYVSYTIKNSSAITAFEIGTAGKYEKTLVASTDEKADTRIVQYEVKSLSNDQFARVKIDLPAAGYHEQYEVRLDYDTTGIALGEGSGIATVLGEDDSINFNQNPNENDSQTTPLVNLEPEETGAEEMTYNRTDDESETSAAVETNPKTGDASVMWIYALLFAASAFVLVKKYRARTL
ncbi:NEAT domain-containing protein [Bacillus sp. NPDC077027]|uniref:NEAT domain-containing protein n=1 Tax=Bacillus sp. NPDC077027 TaxID=3390548 RepID=UPI003CFF4BEE